LPHWPHFACRSGAVVVGLYRWVIGVSLYTYNSIPHALIVNAIGTIK
jgi:hypothetical protein